MATRVISFYNQYFGIDYPLKKCDLVSITEFAAGTYFILFGFFKEYIFTPNKGAMENWGLSRIHLIFFV